MPSFPRAPVLELGRQLAGLKSAYPNGAGTLNQRVLRWSVQIRPTPLSREYLVKIEMRQGARPRVFVPDPCLAELAQGRKIPHLYQQRPAELCLYRPAYGEWAPSRDLARTVIPWAGLWLYYFEDWLIDDEWRGGGEHPRSK